MIAYRNNTDQNKTFVLLGFFLILPFLIWIGFVVYAGIDYERRIEGYLKRAADANTVKLAERELNIALTEIERRGWTKGSTHVIYSTPSCDVGFWYDNLKASRNELNNLNPEASPLEQTNVLMKLRETLIDDEGESISVTAPEEISLFPNNVTFYWTGFLSFLSAIVGFGCMTVSVTVRLMRNL